MSFNTATQYAAILWFGLMAGFFFAYSLSVPQGLLAATPAVGIEAMQAINANIRSAAFAIVFFGSAVVAVLLAVCALLVRSAASWPAVAASVVFLAGAFAVTMLGNVPMNEAFAVLDPQSADAPQALANYFRDWTWLNHIRLTASSAALLLAAVALRMSKA